jgi:hypothetical protein
MHHFAFLAFSEVLRHLRRGLFRSFDVVTGGIAGDRLGRRRLDLNTRAVCQFGFLDGVVAAVGLTLDWGRTESLGPEVSLQLQGVAAFL